MNFIIDGQISEKFAPWLKDNFSYGVVHIKTLGLESSTDQQIFDEARKQNSVIITKDRDFINLLEKNGPPPKIIWVTCGNTSNQKLRSIFSSIFENAVKLLKEGHSLVEVSDVV